MRNYEQMVNIGTVIGMLLLRTIMGDHALRLIASYGLLMVR